MAKKNASVSALIAKEIIENGKENFDLDSEDRDKRTPLYYAAGERFMKDYRKNSERLSKE